MIKLLGRLRNTLQYHAVHNRKAWQIARQLHRNGRRISRRDAVQAWDYAREVLGSHRYAPWLIVYTLFQGRFREGWIPDNYYGDIVAARINQPRDIADFKTFSARVLPPESLPDLGYLIDGQAYDRSYRPMSHEQLAARLFGDAPAVIMKLDRGGSGSGVSHLAQADFAAVVAGAAQQRIVFQRQIRQSAEFDAYSAAGATIRLTTTREPDGSIRLRTGYYRLPAGTATIVRAGEYARLLFDPTSGRAADSAWSADWHTIAEHPTSGARFADLRPAGFADAGELVLRLHATLPHFGCIGWDVMLDQQNHPWILEWNTYHTAVFFAEAVIGPCFRGLNWESLARKRPKRR